MKSIGKAGAFGAVCLAIGALGATSAAAQEVMLTSRATGFTLSGTLVEFDGENYVIQSNIGRLTINIGDVDCAGAGCPVPGAGAATGGESADDGDVEVAVESPEPVETPEVGGAFAKTFGVTGSNTIGQSLMPGLIEAYSFALGAEAEREVGAEQAVFRLLDEGGAEVAAINLTAKGSSTAFPGLLSGDTLIGMSSRPVRASEVEDFETAGFDGIDKVGSEHILALDGLIVIVSPDNPLRTINVEDIAAVFSGEIDNWASLGGLDAPINVYARDAESGTFETFKELILEPLGAELAPNAQRFEAGRDLADAVAKDPNAIGFTGLALRRNARALSLEGSCGLIIEPTTFNVKTEEYPLSRRLYLYTTGQTLPEHAKGLLDFALSDDAQGEISDIGFVSQKIASISLNDQGRRVAEAFIQPRDPAELRMMREMALELLDAERLSTTLRFQRNSSVLDVKSESDLVRLARFIASGDLENKEIVLIGFADDVDRFEAALSLSEQRALQILASLEAELTRLGAGDVAELSTLGFGPLAPVACNDDEYTGASNRRVEVWIRDAL